MRNVRAVVDDLIGAWHQNDAHRAAAFFAPDGRFHEANGNVVRGREAIHEHFARYFRDGPLWRLEVDTIVTEGDAAAVSYRFGTKGDGERWHERAGCAIVRCERGAIVEWREYQGETMG